MNDFGAIVAASLAHDIEIHLAILVKSNWRIFLIGNGKIQEFLSAKEWQDLMILRNANGFTVLTGTRPGRRVVFLMLH
jgi:hypothetical protein